MGPSRSFVLHIGTNPAKASSSGRTDWGIKSLAVVVHRAALGEPHLPLDKGKGKINEIRYPSGSEYLRAVIQNVCNTPKYTLVVFDMFRVFCKHNLTVS